MKQPGLGTCISDDFLPFPQARVDLLEQVTREHEHFQAGVDEFQLWLKAMMEKVSSCLGRSCKLSTKHRLCMLQVNSAASPSRGPLRKRSNMGVLCCCLSNRMCWETQNPWHMDPTYGEAWDLGRYVWGLGCFLEVSEPAGHLETQGHSSMVWTKGSQIGDFWKCLEASFGCYSWGVEMQLASNGWGPETHRTVPSRVIRLQMSVVLWVRSPGAGIRSTVGRSMVRPGLPKCL